MTQNNEIPDVQYYDPHYARWSDTELTPESIMYIRHGAPSPWIDPNVQPIPEDLPGERQIYTRWLDAKGRPCVIMSNAYMSRKYQAMGRILEYVILPE